MNSNPEIGQRVNVHISGEADGEAGTIDYVWGPSTVNVKMDDGRLYTSVRYIGDGADPSPYSRFCLAPTAPEAEGTSTGTGTAESTGDQTGTAEGEGPSTGTAESTGDQTGDA